MSQQSICDVSSAAERHAAVDKPYVALHLNSEVGNSEVPFGNFRILSQKVGGISATPTSQLKIAAPFIK